MSSNNKNYSRQNGVELIGNNNLFSDLEIIAMSKIFLEKINKHKIDGIYTQKIIEIIIGNDVIR